MNTTELKIGKALRKERLLKNYSQEYMASKLGISQEGYSKIENDKVGISIEKVKIISEILETDIHNLLNPNGTQISFYDSTINNGGNVIETMHQSNKEILQIVETQFEKRIQDIKEAYQRELLAKEELVSFLKNELEKRTK